MEIQKKSGSTNLTLITLDHYLYQIENGYPRALDSLFATPILTELSQEALRGTIDPYEAVTMFTRESLSYLVEPTLKNRHHFARINANLKTLIATGSYNPETTSEAQTFFKHADHLTDEEWKQWAHTYALETAECLRSLL